MLLFCAVQPILAQEPPVDGDARASVIRTLDPPELGFFAKLLDAGGIPIKAPAVVEDRALFEAKRRIDRELQHMPNARYNLHLNGAELHIIGRDQGTSDLPEWRHAKGKPFDGKLTIDERTRGMGGLMTSCGEENLLNLEKDRYRGRDICTHEFAHCILNYGLTDAIRARVSDELKSSTARGLWLGSYAATNADEFFAELTMWYFGTHGDMNMKGIKPANGRKGLKAYDPAAFKLLDDLYSGRVQIERQPKST